MMMKSLFLLFFFLSNYCLLLLCCCLSFFLEEVHYYVHVHVSGCGGDETIQAPGQARRVTLWRWETGGDSGGGGVCSGVLVRLGHLQHDDLQDCSSSSFFK